MRSIKYEEYVKHVENRLVKYSHNLSWYTWKYVFIKPNISYPHLYVLFRRYMHNDIFINCDINWDIEDEKD